MSRITIESITSVASVQTPKAPEVIVGIDLGTTNSLVAICQNKIPTILKDRSGSGVVPSIVHWTPGSSAPLVGRLAKRFKVTDLPHTAFSVKRYMGKGKADLNESETHSGLIDTTLSSDQNIVIRLGDKTFSAIELSAEILKKLKSLAEEALGVQVKKAVVTVPAYFNDSQRSATKAAGVLAGLDVIRIVNEPTAAALAYGLDLKKNGHIAVYDLGGGTFDISILRLHDGIFEVLATGGDTSLGGDDFDQALFQILKGQVRIQTGRHSKDQEHKGANTSESTVSSDSLEDVHFRALLLEIAERFKIQLAIQKEVEEEISWGDQKQIKLKLTRDELNQAIGTLVEKTLSITRSTLKDSGLEVSQIDDVVMVGGSTRLLLVREKVTSYFNRELNTSLNPDEVVALGAAIQADILAGSNQDMVLLDVVPLSLGIETYGGTIGKLIHRNTKIPAMAKETFTTHVEGQRNVLIHVLQGERELASDCRSLARFDLRGLPPMPAGLPKIEVVFLVDANGLLTVKAKELATGLAASVEVKPSYGLTDEQVEKMLSDSFEFAEKDMKARQLIDTRVEAEGILKAAEKILREGRELEIQSRHTQNSLPGGSQTDSSQVNQASAVENQILKVKNLLTGVDYLAIRSALDELEETAKPLAELVMNQALKGALKNKPVHEIVKN